MTLQASIRAIRDGERTLFFARGLFICQRNRQMFEGISGAFQVCAGRIQTLRS